MADMGSMAKWGRRQCSRGAAGGALRFASQHCPAPRAGRLTLRDFSRPGRQHEGDGKRAQKDYQDCPEGRRPQLAAPGNEQAGKA